MKLTIQLFAGLSDIFQKNQISVQVKEDSISVHQLKQLIIKQYPQTEQMVRQAFIAKNQTYAAPEEHLSDGDEIALIPPVSGGQGDTSEQVDQSDVLYQITYDAIHIDEVTRKIIHPHNGASIAFVGTTREWTHGQKTTLLEYEAYIPMALKALKQIGDEIQHKWKHTYSAISHRLGKVEIGEISVIIAISSPHRADCYDASRYAIERLKQIVPIWKKEIWEDGSEWKGHQLGPWDPTKPLNFE